MIGLALTTVSPSSSSATRSTPWVEGCWGPMLRVMVSVCTVLHLLRRELFEGRRGQAAPRGVVGERDLLVAERGVLAERPADPVLGEQDAGQVGMAGELDAAEIEVLALVPVRGRPHRCHRRHARVLLGDLELEVEPGVARERGQAVDDLEARLARQVVHATEPRQHGEVELGVVAQEARNLDDALDRDVPARVPHRLPGLAAQGEPGEALAQAFLDPLGGERRHAAPLRRRRATGPSSTREARIFSWSFMMPWI